VEEELKSIIILSGPVGAGKTTVGKELVKLLDGPVVYIEGDTFGFSSLKMQTGLAGWKTLKW
jgi:tRNA A37 threonylcarbamoyladenosine biosynthesis protein TsaE